MNLTITFKNLDSSDALKSYLAKRMNKFERLFDDAVEIKIVLSMQNRDCIVEAQLNAGEIHINAKETRDNMHTTINAISDNLRLQITKIKGKKQTENFD